MISLGLDMHFIVLLSSCCCFFVVAFRVCVCMSLALLVRSFVVKLWIASLCGFCDCYNFVIVVAAAAVVVIVIAFFFAVLLCSLCTVHYTDTFRHIFSARVMALLSNTSFKHFMNFEISHNIMHGPPSLSLSLSVDGHRFHKYSASMQTYFQARWPQTSVSWSYTI